MKRLLLIAVMLGLVIASDAQAADTVPPNLAPAYDQALAFWGIASVPGCEVTVEEVAFDLPAEGVSYGCHMTHAESDTGFIRIHPTDSTPACLVAETIAHEMGHLLGYEHSADRDSIMYPSGSRLTPFCSSEQAAYWEGRADREAERCRHRRRGHRSPCWEQARSMRGEAARLWAVSSIR